MENELIFLPVMRRYKSRTGQAAAWSSLMAFLSQLRTKHLWIPPALLFAALLFLFYTEKINVSCASCNVALHQDALQGSAATTAIHNDDDDGGEEEEAGAGDQEQRKNEFAAANGEEYPLKAIKDQLRLMRSWAPDSTWAPTCQDGGIFVYEMPAKFNKDILSWYRSCRLGMCKYLRNGELGPAIPKLGRSAYGTHQFSLEPIFHSRVLNHPCRVRDPGDAAIFYVPFYAGLHNFMCHMNDSPSDVADGLGIELVKWLEGQRWWHQRGGSDHMFVLGMISWDFRRQEDADWGSNFLLLDKMNASYRFLIERNPWDGKEIGIPYPSYFHPHGDADVTRWQARVLHARRKTLVAFAGAARPKDPTSIRSALIKMCKSARHKRCKFLNCAKKKQCEVASVVAQMLKSEFCLQPPGDSPTRKSMFDSLASGCIPVVFNALSAYYQYPWHLPREHEKYSVFIAEEEVRKEGFDVVQRLEDVSREKREEMRRYIVQELMPGLVYGDSTARFEKFQDAFDITVNSFLHKINKFGY